VQEYGSTTGLVPSPLAAPRSFRMGILYGADGRRLGRVGSDPSTAVRNGTGSVGFAKPDDAGTPATEELLLK